MYKNVLNQYSIGVILLFSSCFVSNAQTINENPPAIYANGNTASDHPLPDTIKIQKKSKSDTTDYLPDDHVLVYRLTFFYTFGK